MQIVKEGLAQDGEIYQNYFELLTQLEEQGNGMTAYEIMQKFFSKMPMEKRIQFIKELIVPDEVLQEILAELPPERLQKIREIVLNLSPKQN